MSTLTPADQPRIAVLLPCYNEEITVAKVVHDFKKSIPEARVLVFDNNSRDNTAAAARAAGAEVVKSVRQGKGNVVRHMFDTVDADIYVMADGDDTYPASEAPKLILELAKGHADMVVGTRMNRFGGKSFRRFHQFGNHFLSSTIRILFRSGTSDVLSGYRVFTREFVKAVPLVSEGFEIETELTLQAIAKGFLISELPISYGERPEGSVSKLSTFSDGWIILRAIGLILKDYKPLLFFSLISGLLLLASLVAGSAPILDFVHTGFVVHLPRAVLAASLAILAAISFGVGLILETVHRYHLENFLLWRRAFREKS